MLKAMRHLQAGPGRGQGPPGSWAGGRGDGELHTTTQGKTRGMWLVKTIFFGTKGDLAKEILWDLGPDGSCFPQGPLVFLGVD